MTLALHVGHLNLDKGFRGGEQQTLALIDALIGQVRQTAIVNRGSVLARQLADRDAAVDVAGSPIAAVPATRGFDLLHVHEGRSVQTAALRYLLSRTPFIVTRRVPNQPSSAALWCYRRAARIVAVSHDISDRLRRIDAGLPLTCVHDCVPNLPAVERGTAAAIRGDARLVIGQSGELDDSHKGQRLTIELARRVAATHPRLLFLLIGRGRDEELLRSEAEALDNVRFVGWTDRIADYYDAMDIMVYPSRYEGLGSAMLEAMSFGVPVVAANVGGIPEIVQDGLSGSLFAPGDIDDFHRCLMPLLDEEDLRLRLGATARARAAEFSAAAMAASYLDIYREVTGRDS